MKAKKPMTPYRKQKNALLAMVHIAKKDLGVFDDDYRSLLRKEFGLASSAAMSIKELERLMRIFKKWGFVPKPRPRPKGQGQAKALQTRAKNEAKALENGDERLKGLVKRICKTDKLEWCKDVRKLKSLLAALRKIEASELESANKNTERREA
jgi:phage gp16-like protein